MHSNPDKPEVLQSVITAAAAGEHQKRRRALEITFLTSKQPAAAAAAPAAAGAAAAASAAAAVAAVEAPAALAAAAATAAVPVSSSSSSEEDPLGDDDDDVAAAGDEGFEGGYSKHTRHRIAEAPGDIAAELGVPLARWVDTTTTKLGQSHACTKTRLIGHTPQTREEPRSQTQRGCPGLWSSGFGAVTIAHALSDSDASG